MNPSVDTTLRNLNDCDCCVGRSAQTPVHVYNRPGLKAVAYRVGTHSQFKQTMLAALSKSGRAALQNLNTRDEDDFSIALLDAWSVVADVLTFYQGRIANESYLRTATERRSVLEMAKAIGYELNPGVAASTYLAFTLETAEGSPSFTKIGIGTKAQSVPGPDEKAQIFETVEEIEARGAWNELKPQLDVPQDIGRGTTKLYLKGTDTQLQRGDVILLVGDSREHSPLGERWDFRILQTVTTDNKKNHTIVTWKEALGHYTCKDKSGNIISKPKPTVEPADNPRVFAFRQRAALFGHNAPDWRSMSEDVRKAYAKDDWDEEQWPKFEAKEDHRIYLDAAYPKILENSWIVLTRPSFVELYKAVRVVTDSRTDFALTSKTTRIDTDTGVHLDWFRRRETVVFAQSEQLELAKQPLERPVFGNSIVLGQSVEVLKPSQKLIVSGKLLRQVKVAERTRIIRADQEEITETEKQLFSVSDDSSEQVALESGDLLEIAAPPKMTPEGLITWHLKDKNGSFGSVTAELDDLIPVPATKNESAASQTVPPTDDEQMVSEVVTLDKIEPVDDFIRLVFTSELQNTYERDSVTINANVVLATHGESTSEVLGSGDASQAFQRFILRQSPLTYVSAPTPSGAETTLEVRVNDLLWREVTTFYGHGSDERIYVTYTDDDGKTTVQFGDGRTGARLPTGKENVRASYRKGIGLGGLVKVRQISQLMTRPLGLKSVTNPLPAIGAQDSESLEEARRNAPLTVLTMDRIVSLQDYENFARAYSGIAKALATWTWDGEKRAVFLTVAGPKGAAVERDSTLYENLLTSMRKAGDPHVPLQIESYDKALFQVGGSIKVHPDYLSDQVLAAVELKLREHFSFDARAFGQPVTLSEVMAIIQQMSGVAAVFIKQLYVTDTSADLNTFLEAKMPQAGKTEVSPAQLLTLDPCELGLEVIS